MFNIERYNEIVEYLIRKKSASVKQLAKKLFVAEATIRRDLAKLDSLGLIKRTHGGAIYLDEKNNAVALIVRETTQKKEKDDIGFKASKIFPNHGTIIMDSSSTVLSMVQYIKPAAFVTVITNGAKTVIDLTDVNNINVYGTGGVLRKNSYSFTGAYSCKMVEDFNADFMFFSCRAISMDSGLSDINESEVELRRVMMSRSKCKVLLCDSTKFNKTSPLRICNFDKIDYIITDIKPTGDWIEFFESNNVNIIY